MIAWSMINPRRACARVTVVVLSVCVSVCLSVCLSVCSRSSCFSVRWNQQTTILTGLSSAFLGIICVEFRKNLPFESYGVKKPICK